MIELDFDIDLQALDGFIDASEAALERAMYLAIVEYHGDVIEEMPSDMGQMRSSLQLDHPEPLVGKVFSALGHALWVRDGTRPIERLPWAPIDEWASRKGIPTFPVWHKIRTQGITANPYHERAWQRTRGRLQEFMDMAVRSES